MTDSLVVPRSAEPMTAPPSPRAWTLATRFLAHPAAIPLASFLLSFLVRLYYANEGLFHIDEVQLANAVEGSVARHRLLPETRDRYGMVLLDLLLYLPYRLVTGARAERVVVFAGILLGAVLAAAIALLVEEVTGDRLAAALAGPFLCFNCLFLTSSTTGKENVPQLAFFVAALWLVARGANRGSLALRAAGMAAFAFALTLHEAGLPLIPVFLAFVFSTGLSAGLRPRQVARDLAAALAILAVPFAAYLGRTVWRALTIPETYSVEFMGIWSENMPRALRDVVTIAPPYVLALCLLGAFVLLVRHRALWPVLLLPLLLLYYGNVNQYGPRQLLYLLPAVAILAAIGTSRLARAFKQPPLRAAVALAALAGVCGVGFARAHPLIAARSAFCGPKRTAIWVRDQVGPDAVVVAMDDGAWLKYYGGLDPSPHPMLDPREMVAWIARLKELARDGKRVYIGPGGMCCDATGTLRPLLDLNFALVPVGVTRDEAYFSPELEDVSFPHRLFRLFPRVASQSATPARLTPGPAEPGVAQVPGSRG